jgi:hypothetical protein
MSPADQPGDLPDRIIRQSLRNPANLRDFLRDAVPHLADGFDYDRARVIDREFFLDDWRRREADLPFEIPYRTTEGEELALVYVLIEHQSDTDPFLPLRMLYETVCYWDRQWREWEALPRPRPPFRLRPVLPVVLYTGATPWGSNRTLADLLGEPAVFHAFAPTWQPVFWNLADHTPEALLQSGAEWLEALAVLRAQGEDTEAFLAVFRQALQGLAVIHERETVRWSELVRMVLAYSLQRRPASERNPLMVAVTETYPERREEVQNMTKTIAESLMEEGELRGIKRLLRRLLENKFGNLPPEVVQQIDVASDADRLEEAALQAHRLARLEDLHR